MKFVFYIARTNYFIIIAMHLSPYKNNRKRIESQLGKIQIADKNSDIESCMLTPSKEPIHLEQNKSTTRKYMRIPDRIINLEAMSKIKTNRGRIIDWFFEVFSIYRLGWECFWLCAELLEDLITNYDYVTLNNLHIVGITCIFISSKYVNTSPIKLIEVIDNISHRHFSKEQVIEEEKNILNMIFCNGWIQRDTMYHFLMEQFHHFQRNTLCRGNQILALVWMRIDEASSYLKVGTYRQIVHKMMEIVIYEIDPQWLSNLINQNESEWKTYSWKKYSHKINL